MKAAKIARILREEWRSLQEDLAGAVSYTLRLQLQAQLNEVEDVAVLLGVWEIFNTHPA